MSRSRLALLAVVILLIIFLPGYSKLQQVRAKHQELLEKIAELEKDNDRLATQIERLEQDTLYIEKKAREKMGLSGKGEIIYKVKDNVEVRNE